MEFSGAEQLNQAINSPADLSRDDLLVVLKECSNIQNTYSQQSAVNKLINSYAHSYFYIEAHFF